MKFYTPKNLLIITFSILSILGARNAKAAFAAEPHGDEHLHKYAQNPAFDASLPIKGCSASRIRIDKDDPIDFYLTAAHCFHGDATTLLPILQGDVQPAAEQKGINYIISLEGDLAIFTNNILSNKPKYELYEDNLSNLVGETVTQVAFGESLLDKANDYKPQAFVTSINSVRSKRLLSIPFMPDPSRTLQDPPIGTATSADSGGSLLFKKDGEYEYKLAGIVSESIIKSDYKSIYDQIPNDLKSNSRNQHCAQMMSSFRRKTDDGSCYSDQAIWEGIDLGFIKDAKERFLKKQGIYIYPTETKPDRPTITFKLKNNDKTIQYVEKKENFFGDASKDTQLNVLINGRVAFTIPFQLGNIDFTYQSEGKLYPIQIIVEKSKDGNDFIVKGFVRSALQDQSTNNPLKNTLIADNSQHNLQKTPSFAPPVLLVYSALKDFPLEVSLYDCLLFNESSVDTDSLENMKILGYLGSEYIGRYNYDLVFTLNGQKIKEIQSYRINNSKTSFEYQYAGNTYEVSITSNKGNSGIYSINRPLIKVTVVNLRNQGFYNLDETAAAFPEDTSIYFVSSSGMAGDAPVSVKLSDTSNSCLNLFIANKLINNIDLKEGCQYFSHNNNGSIYAIAIDIQKFDVPKKHYSVALTVKELERDLSPTIVSNHFPQPHSCQYMPTGFPVKYRMYNFHDLDITLVLDKTPIGKVGKDYSDHPIRFGNEDSIIYVLLDGKELARFKLDTKIDQPSIEFEKDGNLYSLSVELYQYRDNTMTVQLSAYREYRAKY